MSTNKGMFNWLLKQNTRKYQKAARKPRRGAYVMTPSRVKKIAKSVINQESETKYHDKVVSSANAFSNAMTKAQHLTEIASGDNEGQRDGEFINPLSLFLRLSVLQSGSATNSFARIAIVVDTESSGTEPTPGEVFETTSYESPLESNNRGRFKILYDETMDLVSATSSAQSRKIYIKLKGKIQYTGSLGSNVSNGHIYLFVGGSEGVNFPTYTLYSRLKYQE